MTASPVRTGVVRRTVDPTAADEWAALAPLLAARGKMRLSPDGGRNYPGRGVRLVTKTLPSQPAAVHLFDRSGSAPVIALDLDSSRGDVTRDLAAIDRLLTRHGARWFSDTSPNGGRHVYIPLAEPAPLHEARAFVQGLAARTPTLDVAPMTNVDAGCIRPPGAWHRTGGHQRLDTSIARAVDTFQHPLPSDAWSRLLCDVAAPGTLHPEADTADVFDPDARPDAEESLEALHGWTAPDAEFTRIARTGQWPEQKYRSPSEARQGVLWSCAASGWRLVDVVRRISDGTWPGLASFYARYGDRHRHGALVRDWRNAIAFERSRRAKGSKRDRSASASKMKPVRKRTTSTHQAQAGAPQGAGTGPGIAPHRAVRVWLAAVDHLSPRLSPTTKAVLYALAEASAVTGHMEVEHGTRSLAIATGLDYTTVGRVLKALREAPADMTLIDLVRTAEGIRADTYALVVPPLLRASCERKPWRRGRIYAVRPAFRALGMSAAFLYDVLERARGPISGRQAAKDAGLGHSAASEALLDLHAWGLADRVPHRGWVLGDASLARLAEQFGCDEMVAEQVARYRAQRLAWWRWLRVITDAIPFPEPDAHDADEQPVSTEPERSAALAHAPPVAPATPSPNRARWHDDEVALLDLLERELGAVLVG
jgi:hypothetical protein